MTAGEESRCGRGMATALLVAAAFLVETPADAGDISKTGRGALISEYLEASREHPPLYQSAPITHVVPAFNTISYSLALARHDVRVTPDLSSGGFGSSELRVRGYTVSPYMALSLKRVGLGFSVEAGHREVDYTDHGWSERSALDYRGVGAYLYLIPFAKWKRVTPTVILGGRSYNAKHLIDAETYSYNVPSYELGLNVGVHLLKGFSVVPWADYTHNDTRGAIAAVERKAAYAERGMRDDVELFWHDAPRVNYGIDFAVRLGGFEVRLGGLFGMIADLDAGAENVVDETLRLSVSFSQKGG